jgi:hypothetical protein
MAMPAQQDYVQAIGQERSGIVNLSTGLVKKIMRPRWFSAVLHAFAVLICALIFNLISVDMAQAHLLHPHDTAQVETLLDHPVEDGDTTSQDGSASAERDCSVTCCSPSHCASGLVAASPLSFFMGYLTDHFVLTPAKTAMSLGQATLKRPPKS